MRFASPGVKRSSVDGVLLADGCFPTIGVLAVQGAAREHLKAVKRCGASVLPVKNPEEISLIDGLIIPGGESTTIGKLMENFGLIDPIKRRAAEGMSIFGTCAGLILLAKRTTGETRNLLGLVDYKARRNAFGRQVDSFEADISIEAFGAKPFRAVFIRAPWVEEMGPAVKELAMYDGHPILVEQDQYLASAFHPELTDDLRMHKYFLDKVSGRKKSGVRSQKSEGKVKR